MSQPRYETAEDVLIRQNATQIGLLEKIHGMLVGILLVLLIPIVVGFLAVFLVR